MGGVGRYQSLFPLHFWAQLYLSLSLISELLVNLLDGCGKHLIILGFGGTNRGVRTYGAYQALWSFHAPHLTDTSVSRAGISQRHLWQPKNRRENIKKWHELRAASTNMAIVVTILAVLYYLFRKFVSPEGHTPTPDTNGTFNWSTASRSPSVVSALLTR